MAERILLLGGTREAVQLANNLLADGHHVITSLAGRTRDPAPVAGEIRTGGFGGPKAMAEWISKNRITKVIDATHPFARQISENAVEACRLAAIPLTQHKRQPWQQEQDDLWQEVETLADAADAIPSNSKVLLALGSQHLAPFIHRDDVHFLVRMVDPPVSPLLFAKHELIVAKPSPNWKDEADLLKRCGVTHIVCRNSGGEGAYAKIVAARHLAIPVIIVTMPQ